MNWIEEKYISLLNSRVRNFKRKSSNLWNFSCPLCGDSERNPRRARGYVYERSGQVRFHCHKCGKDHKFSYFLKLVDEGLYSEMKKELLLETMSSEQTTLMEFEEKFRVPDHIKKSGLNELVKVSSLSHKHYCKQYVDSRKIPTTFHHELFFAEKFRDWTNSMLPGKFEKKTGDGPRLVIPFFDKNKNLIGYQGRALKPIDERIKYFTIMLDSDGARMYGLDRVDFNRRYFCVEGPIDSMFVENAIASAGADIVSELQRTLNVKENAVIVYDNEPNKIETVQKIEKAINLGYKVVIWPDIVTDKDINNMFLAGLKVQEILNQHIYSGLKAKLRLTQWKRT